MSESPDRRHEQEGGAFRVEPLRCVECATLSGRHARRWRSYRIDDPTENEEPAVAFYCPACAEREFGTLGHGPKRRKYLS